MFALLRLVAAAAAAAVAVVPLVVDDVDDDDDDADDALEVLAFDDMLVAVESLLDERDDVEVLLWFACSAHSLLSRLQAPVCCVEAFINESDEDAVDGDDDDEEVGVDE